MGARRVHSVRFVERKVRLWALVASLVLVFAADAQAATITPNTTVDELNSDGDCSLREAIKAANTDSAVDACPAGSGADTIDLAAGTYTLAIAGSEDGNASGDLDILGDLTIDGAGSGSTVLDGDSVDRVLDVSPLAPNAVDVELVDITVRRGLPTGPFGGGGILNLNDGNSLALTRVVVAQNSAGGSNGGGIRSGQNTLTLNGSAVTNNTAVDAGAGIVNGGRLALTDSVVAGNTLTATSGGSSTGGAGIWFSSNQPLTLLRTAVTGNAAEFHGGGIRVCGSPATITESLVSGNTVGTRLIGFGGGISLPCGPGNVMISNSTISGNAAANEGGGIFTSSGGLSIADSTLSGNSAEVGGGVRGSVGLSRSILANSPAGGDCSGGISSGGYNLIEDTSGCSIGGDTTGNITGSDPVLGPLQNNGGPTHTHALLDGSPAIDASSPDCPPPATDQRGVARAQGTDCDIGAFEVNLTYPTPSSASHIDVSLVPTFRQTISATQCTARGGTPKAHGPPFSVTSCDPPAFLPGTRAFFGRQSVGSAQLVVIPGDLGTPADEADDAITASLTDVRQGSVTGADYNPNPAGDDVTLVVRLRITDLLNGPTQTDPGTASDIILPVPVNCTPTVDTTVGATCSVNTTADAVIADAVKEGKQAVISAFKIHLDDAGSDGIRGNSDDRNFAQQGIFNP